VLFWVALEQKQMASSFQGAAATRCTSKWSAHAREHAGEKRVQKREHAGEKRVQKREHAGEKRVKKREHAGEKRVKKKIGVLSESFVVNLTCDL
jgi:hypothetical protein